MKNLSREEKEYLVGQWVMVWAQVADADSRPEEIPVTLFSKSDEYVALIESSRVEQVALPPRKDWPEFMRQCTALYGGNTYEGMYWRCSRPAGHADLHTANGGALEWYDSSTVGHFEEA